MNNTLGFIPMSEDRNIFDMRRSFIQSLHPLGKEIVTEFERFFIGNNYSGYKFHKILSQLIDDYELWLKSPRNYSLDFWFDYNKVSEIYQVDFVPTPHWYYKTSLDVFRAVNGLNHATPYYFNRLINSDSRYLGLKRSDLKLSPISLVLNFNSSYFGISSSVKSLRAGAVIGETMLTGYFPDSPRKSRYVTMGILRDFIINLAPQTPTNLSSKYNYSFFGYPDGFTPPQFIQIMRDTIDAIKFLETFEVGINFKGNTEGLKINEYEAILSDQLNYLNGLTDKVQNSLLAEKLVGQELKDSLEKAIVEKQKILNEEIAKKRQNIGKLAQKIQELSMIHVLK